MKNVCLSYNFLKDRSKENKGVQNKETIVYHLKMKKYYYNNLDMKK